MKRYVKIFSLFIIAVLVIFSFNFFNDNILNADSGWDFDYDSGGSSWDSDYDSRMEFELGFRL